MAVLVDSSVWIDYFKGKKTAEVLDDLIDHQQIVTNDIILWELVPPLRLRRENQLVLLLKAIEKIPVDLDWAGLNKLQLDCLKNGINKIGLSDLMIAHHAFRHKVDLFSFDKHFKLIQKVLSISLFSPQNEIFKN